MYLLTEWEGRTGKYLALAHDVRNERSEAQPNSFNKHFIIWPFHMDHFGAKQHSQPRESEHKRTIITLQESIKKIIKK